MELTVDVQRCTIRGDRSNRTESAQTKADRNKADDGEKSQVDRDLADEIFRIGRSEIGEDDVERDGCVQCQCRLCWIHEAFLFVWLQREDRKPQIERRKVRDSTQ